MPHMLTHYYLMKRFSLLCEYRELHHPQKKMAVQRKFETGPVSESQEAGLVGHLTLVFFQGL